MILDYCLGLLIGDQKVAFEKEMQKNPDLQAAVASLRAKLEQGAGSTANGTPKYTLQNKTWALVENVIKEKKMDPADLPLLNKHSDTNTWAALAGQYLPKKLDKSRPYMRLLTGTDRVTQVLIATSEGFPDEEHDDLLESFIILEGECECRIGSDTVRVKAGGYLEIPLHTSHDVRIISDGIVGVLQRINLSKNEGAMQCK
ncbi:MAG: cupin domain-containing protein [Bacteroidetes bacterium]|nr:cupin domain-containing protein [Bacteroidota bacterium]